MPDVWFSSTMLRAVRAAVDEVYAQSMKSRGLLDTSQDLNAARIRLAAVDDSAALHAESVEKLRSVYGLSGRYLDDGSHEEIKELLRVLDETYRRGRTDGWWQRSEQ